MSIFRKAREELGIDTQRLLAHPAPELRLETPEEKAIAAESEETREAQERLKQVFESIPAR